MIEAHAPGKLLLSGEYAVLAGAPAVVVAVGARARAVLSPSPQMQLSVSGRPFSFSVEPSGRLRWQDPPPAGHGELLEAAVAGLGAVNAIAEPQPVEIHLDSSEFSVEGADGKQHKLGLGSSAAVLVALLAALDQAWELGLDAANLCELARSAHQHFQGGRGSGVDVVTAVYGGVLAMGMDGPGQPELLRWPGGLELVAVWSGRSASTPAMIARLDAFHARRPADAKRHLEALTDQATQAVCAWQAGDIATIMASADAYFDALCALDREAGIGIVTDAHARLRALARREGAIYKTSGAGGGDLGFAMTADPDVAARLRSVFAAAGYPVVDQVLAVPGVEASQA